jgi:hypothetical protein
MIVVVTMNTKGTQYQEEHKSSEVAPFSNFETNLWTSAAAHLVET